MAKIKGVILLIFLLIGLFLCSFGVYFLYIEGNLRHWPIAQGRVYDTQIADLSRSGSTPSFKPIIFYKYIVNEREYSNNRLTVISRTYGKKSDAQDVISKYQVHQNVDVFYNPLDPQDSILKQQSQMVSYAIILSGMLISSVSIIIILRNKTKK